jgi:hypothetical protein
MLSPQETEEIIRHIRKTANRTFTGPDREGFGAVNISMYLGLGGSGLFDAVFRARADDKGETKPRWKYLAVYLDPTDRERKVALFTESKEESGQKSECKVMPLEEYWAAVKGKIDELKLSLSGSSPLFGVDLFTPFNEVPARPYAGASFDKEPEIRS